MTNKPIKKSQTPATIDGFITKAIESNAPIETMERLFELHKEVKKEKARADFVQAMANFQKDCPVIEKTKIVYNKDGKTVRYKFAPLDSIIEQIKEKLANNGLSYTWTVENKDGNISATAKITHVSGHSTVSTFTVPIDTEGYMTAPQKYASAQTFAKRYALCNALGISTGDEDTDATDVKNEKNASSPKSKIMFSLKTLGYEATDRQGIEKAVKESTGYDLEEKNFNSIVEALEILVTEKQEYDYENSQV